MKKTILAVTVALVAGGFAGKAYAEKQGHMHAALGSLNAALGQLEKATEDKGGHRVKAIALVKQAIDETKAGIEFDNKH